MGPQDLEEIGAVHDSLHSGDHSRLVKWLRSGRMLNQSTRDYLADYLDGKVKRKRGRKPKPSIYGKNTSARILRSVIRLLYEQKKVELVTRDQLPGSDIEREAIEQVADQTHLTEGQISHILYPRN